MFDKLKFWNRKKELMVFYCHPDLHGVIPEPEPAAQHLPKWFKTLNPYFDGLDKFGEPNGTAKKCLPLIDSMAMGYVLRLGGDVRIRSNRDCTQIEHLEQPQLKLIEYHPSAQVGGNNTLKNKQGPIIKFVNHWVIKTAPGWSTLFEPLPNVFDSPFTCLSGLVDTDMYPMMVNFPAVWNVPDADIQLKAGTPLVRVIPIERAAIKKMRRETVVRKITKQEFDTVDIIKRTQETRNHYYIHELRVKK